MQKIGDITDTADGNGEFTDGNVAGNVQPTELMAAWFNSVQRELIAVLTAAGITPDKGSDAQLIEAIKHLLATGIAGSGYLVSENNLSDLEDVPTALRHLGLDNVGNWAAVEANGGKHSSGNHHMNIDWDGKKLHYTVDDTDVGEAFTTQNPPTAAQTGAYPRTGGNLDEEASISLITDSKNPSVGDYIYSPMYRVVIKDRGGDQDFKDGASFFLRMVEQVGTLAYGEIVFDGFGSIKQFKFDQSGNIQLYGKVYTGTGASFLAEDGNVYGAAWGGYLSTWVNNNFQLKNTGNPGGGWWRDSATGLIIQAGTVAVPVSGSAGSASFSFPLTFPNGVVSIVGSTADQASAAGYVACAAFLNLSTTGGYVMVDTNASRNMDRTQYVRYIAYGV